MTILSGSFILVTLSINISFTLTSDPVPELEHVGLVDAELFDLGRVCGERGKVFRHMRILQVDQKYRQHINY